MNQSPAGIEDAAVAHQVMNDFASGNGSFDLVIIGLAIHIRVSALTCHRASIKKKPRRPAPLGNSVLSWAKSPGRYYDTLTRTSEASERHASAMVLGDGHRVEVPLLEAARRSLHISLREFIVPHSAVQDFRHQSVFTEAAHIECPFFPLH